MKSGKRAVALLLFSMLTLGISACKSAQNNSNQPNVPAANTKPGKWIAQYRSPASLSYSGMNLAVFYYSGISVVSKEVVFVCGDTPSPKGGDERVGVILRTTDGGQSWTDTPVELPRVHILTLKSIFFISPDVGWAVGLGGLGEAKDGVVLKTTDGGSSWALTRIGHKQDPISVFFLDANNGWMAGSTPPPGEDEGIGGPSALLATTDGGSTWNSRYNMPISLYRVLFIDKMNG